MDKKNIIQPRTLKGFRDFLPDELRSRKKVFRIFEEIFEKYGYEPLETPDLEYYDILAGKYGEEEKLIYNFVDFGGRKVGMRYDQTVPTARVYAQYREQLPAPFRRYVIQKVWRADNTQKGRFREFYQLDADIIGSAGMVGDAEFIDCAIEIIKALGFNDFNVRINNRKILNGIAKYVGREDKFSDIVYAIDKWDKRSPEETKEDLINRGLTKEEAEKVFECIELKSSDSYGKLDELEKKFEGVDEGVEGVKELKEIFNLVIQKKYLEYDPTIARGLAYYTGPIYEFNVIEGGVGSILGGGRYDELIGSMLGEEVPATGGSFGIERILTVMKDRNMITKEDDKTDVLVTVFKEEYLTKSYEIADELRKQGLKVSLYPDAKPLKKQFDYADKKNIDWVVIVGEDEVKENKITVKNMKTGEQNKIELNKLNELIKIS